MKQFKYTINGNDYHVTVSKLEDTLAEVEVNGIPYKVVMDKPAKKQVKNFNRPVQALTSTTIVTAPLPAASRPAGESSGGTVTAPLPGIILSIDCKAGDTVRKGQKLLILEAMKMENTIASDREGVISEIKVNQGDSVLEGADLITLK